MKIGVLGGSGLIGSELVKRLRDQGHQAVPASPASGVDTLTGEVERRRRGSGAQQFRRDELIRRGLREREDPPR